MLFASSAVTQALPRLENPRAAAELLNANYPIDLKLLGIGGLVRVGVLIGKNGKADSVVIADSSFIPSLDEAAHQTAEELQFTKPVTPTWVTVPLQFASAEPQPDAYAQLPQLKNRPALESAARDPLPDRLERGTLGARVRVKVDVDTTGKVVNRSLLTSLCPREFNDAALSAASAGVFDVSTVGRTRTTIITFEFRRDSAWSRLPGEARPKPAQDTITVRGPTEKPQMANTQEVIRVMQRYYPAHLRDRGIGGKAILHLLINEEGRVTLRMIERTSGNCELDAAALEVGQVARFSPGRLNGRARKVWIELPVEFAVR